MDPLLTEPKRRGRPPVSDADRRTTRATRWSDAEWADLLFVGLADARDLVAKEARRRRAKAGAATDAPPQP